MAAELFGLGAVVLVLFALWMALTHDGQRFARKLQRGLTGGRSAEAKRGGRQAKAETKSIAKEVRGELRHLKNKLK